MTITVKRQNLLTIDAEYAICHCISADCAMGAGVVVPIKAKYNGLKERCRLYVGKINPDNADKAAKAAVGRAYRDVSENGVVYNLFSKRYFYQNAHKNLTEPEYHAQLRQCLMSMRDQMLENNEKYLAMPKIACGLDRCKWPDIEKIIIEVFAETDIEILVCVL